MKVFFRIVRISIAVVILITLSLISASFILQDKVAGMILKSLNNEIQTKFEFRSSHLSFLRRFPRASLDLRNVLVHPSPGFDAASFGKKGADTLLFAKSVTGEFSIKDIIRGVYNIDRMIIRQGKLNIFTDSAGKVNYEITAPSATSPTDDNFSINLDRISVSDIDILYRDLATKVLIAGSAGEGKIKSHITGNTIDFTADAKLEINNLSIYNFSVNKKIYATAGVVLHYASDGITIRKGNLEFDRIALAVSGFISEDDRLDLALRGENVNISGIKKYLPDNVSSKISAYDPSGILSLQSTIRGKISRTLNPAIEIKFNLKDGHVSYLNSSLNINALSFKGYFSNGSGRKPSTSVVSFDDINGTLGSASFRGAFLLADFESPDCRLKLEGKLIADEIREFFHVKNISTAKGNFDFNITAGGKIPVLDKFTFNDFLDLKPVAEMNFNSFGIGVQHDSLLLENVIGKISFSDIVSAKDLRFRFRDHDFLLSGSFMNLPEWLSGKPVTLSAKVSLNAAAFRPAVLFPSLADTSSSPKKAFMMPDKVCLDLRFGCDDFAYKTFSADKIQASISYKPGILNFKSLTVNSMDGVISGNGFLVQNKDKSYLGRGTFSISSVDIKKAFTEFRNFGQGFILAENLAGKLTGNISVLVPADSILVPKIKSLSAEGKYSVSDGALVDFKPIEELSTFINISELRDIHFNDLSNDFFIRNNYFYVPQMEVKSSAADLQISGKHSFDNDYEYHIKILLSEMLSKKLHKPRPNTTEFGAVADDGLGRTSVLLKVVNKGEDIKVSYDIKAAGNQVREDIRNERKTLKNILNQEYGWFRKDTASLPDQKETSPRIKVLWGDADTTKVEEEKPQEKNTNPLKNIFRKSK